MQLESYWKSPDSGRRTAVAAVDPHFDPPSPRSRMAPNKPLGWACYKKTHAQEIRSPIILYQNIFYLIIFSFDSSQLTSMSK